MLIIKSRKKCRISSLNCKGYMQSTQPDQREAPKHTAAVQQCLTVNVSSKHFFLLNSQKQTPKPCVFV